MGAATAFSGSRKFAMPTKARAGRRLSSAVRVCSAASAVARLFFLVPGVSALMGFVLLGFVAGVVNGQTTLAANAYSSAMFYIIGYVLTTLASFGIIMLLARQGFESEEISDLAGLNQRSPL